MPNHPCQKALLIGRVLPTHFKIFLPVSTKKYTCYQRHDNTWVRKKRGPLLQVSRLCNHQAEYVLYSHRKLIPKIETEAASEVYQSARCFNGLWMSKQGLDSVFALQNTGGRVVDFFFFFFCIHLLVTWFCCLFVCFAAAPPGCQSQQARFASACSPCCSHS